MTRAEIKAQVALLLREGLGTAGAGDPFTLDALVDQATDAVARRDCFYATFTADLVANQAAYCVPNLYKIKAAAVRDVRGELVPLTATSPATLDTRYGVGRWRNEAAVDPPTHAAFEGLNQIRLHPAPQLNRANGLLLEGFAVPGGTWPADTDECPLPTWAHDAVVYGTCKLRSLQFVGEPDNPAASAKAAAWANEYRQHLGNVEAAAANYYSRQRR